jgi:hypothetical protein
MYEALIALLPTVSTAVFAWLWRKARVERSLAELRMRGAEVELATERRLTTDLRLVLVERNRELKDCREKLPAADRLDDLFNGLPKRDPGRDDS